MHFTLLFMQNVWFAGRARPSPPVRTWFDGSHPAYPAAPFRAHPNPEKLAVPGVTCSRGDDSGQKRLPPSSIIKRRHISTGNRWALTPRRGIGAMHHAICIMRYAPCDMRPSERGIDSVSFTRGRFRQGRHRRRCPGVGHKPLAPQDILGTRGVRLSLSRLTATPALKVKTPPLGDPDVIGERMLPPTNPRGWVAQGAFSQTLRRRHHLHPC